MIHPKMPTGTEQVTQWIIHSNKSFKYANSLKNETSENVF